MKITHYFFFLFLCFPVLTKAQSLSWQWGSGGSGYGKSHDVVALPDGSSIVAGNYEDSLRIGDSSLYNTGSVRYGSFLAKYSAGGSLVFLKKAAQNNSVVRSVTCDMSGNIYTCGVFYDSVLFGATVRYSNGGADMYLACFNPAGDFQWVRSIGGGGADGCEQGSIVSLPGQGGVVICATVQDSFRIDTLRLGGLRKQPLLARFDHTGSLVWCKTVKAAQTISGDGTGDGLSADAAGNIYFTGTLTGYMVFGSQALQGGNRPFFARCRPDGTLFWVKQASGSGILAGSCKAAAGGNGKLAFFSGAPASNGFDALTIAGLQLPASDYYLIAIDSNGESSWVGYGKGPREAAVLRCDAAGDPYLAGSYPDQFSFRGQPLLTKDSGAQAGFVAKFRKNGTVDWARRLGGLSFNGITGLSVAPGYEVMVAGYYNGSMEPGPGIPYVPYNNQIDFDFFLAKMSQTLATPILSTPESAAVLRVFPNPSRGLVHVVLPAGLPEGWLQLRASDGRLVNEQRVIAGRPDLDLDLSEQPAGWYWLQAAGLPPIRFTLVR